MTDIQREILQIILGCNQPSESKPSGGLSSRCVGQYCVFRTYSAGVFVGVLRERCGTEAIIDDARRIHNWSGAFTLSAVAMNGIKGGQMSVVTQGHLLTQVIEVVPCSEAATANLKGYAVHNP